MKKILLPLLALTGLLALPSRAATVVNITSQAAAYTVSSVDLVNGLAPVDSGGNFANEGGSLGKANDGADYSSGGNFASVGSGGGTKLVWDLPAAQAISKIDLTFGWGDGGRDNVPVMNVYVSPNPYPGGNDFSGYTLLASTVETAPANGGWRSRVSITDSVSNVDVATNVRSIYIQFGSVENGWVGLGEVDVFPSFSAPPPVATPTFTPAGGNYNPGQTVSLSTTTSGATIHYTVDGTTPSTNSPVYTAPLTLSSVGTTTVKTFAVKAGQPDSAVASATYVITTTVVNYSSQSGDHTVSATDLINGLTPIATSGGSWAKDGVTGIPAINDGVFSGLATVGYGGPGYSDHPANGGIGIIWNFTNAQDIANLDLYFSWGDPGRDNPPVMNIYASATPLASSATGVSAVDAAVAANGGFSLIATVSSFVNNGQKAKVSISSFTGNLANGVRALYIQFRDAENGYVGLNEVDVFAASVEPTGVVGNPEFTPPAGTYGGAQTVSLSTTNVGAAIHYTLDGSTPTTNSPIYTSSLLISSNMTVKAMATKPGWTNSAVVTANYLIAVTAPAFTPGNGYTFNTTNGTVVLTAVPTNAAIYYTTDGTTPDNVGNGTLYTGPVVVSTPLTLKAIAYAPGFETSAVSQATYLLAAGAPVFTPGGATYGSSLNVSLASPTPNATIYYTLDLTSPDNTTGTLYTGPIPVSADTTIYAIAYAEGMNASPAVYQTYVIDTNILVAWDFTQNNTTPQQASLPATFTAADVQPGSSLTRGGNFAAGYTWNANHFDTQSGTDCANLAAAISNNVYATFTVAPAFGKQLSFSNITLYVSEFMTGGAVVGELLFSHDGFATSTTLGTVTTANGMNGSVGSLDVSGVAALQNCQVSTVFRCYFYGNVGGGIRGLGGDSNARPALALRGTSSVAPVVSSPQLTATSSGGNFSMSFASQSGASYTLQGSTNLTDWSAVTNWTGTGGTILYSVPLGTAPHEFYRVVSP